jgi:hypothetical protein
MQDGSLETSSLAFVVCVCIQRDQGQLVSRDGKFRAIPAFFFFLRECCSNRSNGVTLGEGIMQSHKVKMQKITLTPPNGFSQFVGSQPFAWQIC